jgi:hypothetical protein
MGWDIYQIAAEFPMMGNSGVRNVLMLWGGWLESKSSTCSFPSRPQARHSWMDCDMLSTILCNGTLVSRMTPADFIQASPIYWRSWKENCPNFEDVDAKRLRLGPSPRPFENTIDDYIHNYQLTKAAYHGNVWGQLEGDGGQDANAIQYYHNIY